MEMLERLAFSSLTEQKSKRRWGIFFKLVGFAYLAAVLVAVMDWAPSSEPASSERHTALINVYGAIEAKVIAGYTILDKSADFKNLDIPKDYAKAFSARFKLVTGKI